MNLKDSNITGFVTLPTAEGTCHHCGMWIKYCVIVRDPDTRKEVTIGSKCAERVGLDPELIRNRMTYAERKERQAKREAWEAEKQAEHAKKMAPILEKRKVRALEVAPIVEGLRREPTNDFLLSLADQLESRQELSGRQAEYVCKAFTVTGRRNKKNAAEWDDRFLLITGEEY